MSTQPFVRVRFTGGGAPATGVRSARMIEAEFEHERALVLVDASDPTAKRFASGVPILIEWGLDPAPARFFIGYVSHVEPIDVAGSTDDRSGERLVRVVCVAPSWALKVQGYETFRNVPATHAVKAFGERLRFGVAHVARSPRIEPVLHQGGRSAWEFMVACAKQAGFTLFVRGLQVHCRDRRELVTEGAARAPLLAATTLKGSVREMRTSVGAGSASAAAQEAYAVNPRTGAVLGLKNSGQTDRPVFIAAPSPLGFTQARTGLALADVGEAEDRLAAEERLNRMSVTARLEGGSHPSARVGGVVAVAGFGKASDGYWYVTAAEHEYTGPQHQTMTLRLARDAATAALAPRPLTTVASPGRRNARLVNGKWVLG